MSTILLVLFMLSVLVIGLFVGVTIRLSEKLPKNNPSRYLKKQPLDNSKHVVVFMGDSITHGRIGVNYVEMIEDQLRGNDIEFINAGINSELAWNNLQRVGQVIQCEPDVVTILVGTNDANASLTKSLVNDYVRRMKLPRDPDKEWYKESLSSLVMRLKSETNSKIALISIPTIGEASEHPAFIRSTEYGKIVHEVAEQLDVTYLPLQEAMIERLKENEGNASYPYEKYFIGIIKGIISHYLLRRDWDDIARGSGFSLHVDYLHLNTAGAQLVADLISEFLQSTLAQT
jgi:lysophospholipase L1-like esterase